MNINSKYNNNRYLNRCQEYESLIINLRREIDDN